MGIKRALHRRPSSSQRNANREEYDIRPFDGTNVNAGSHRSDPPKGRQDKLGKKAKCSSRAVEHEDQGGLAFAGRSTESSNPQTRKPLARGLGWMRTLDADVVVTIGEAAAVKPQTSKRCCVGRGVHWEQTEHCPRGLLSACGVLWFGYIKKTYI